MIASLPLPWFVGSESVSTRRPARLSRTLTPALSFLFLTHGFSGRSRPVAPTRNSRYHRIPMQLRHFIYHRNGSRAVRGAEGMSIGRRRRHWPKPVEQDMLGLTELSDQHRIKRESSTGGRTGRSGKRKSSPGTKRGHIAAGIGLTALLEMVLDVIHEEKGNL